MKAGMQSDISVKVDFENEGRPFIRIVLKKSPHIVDETLTRFISSLGREVDPGGHSQLCEINWSGAGINPNDEWERYDIYPILPKDLPQVASVINESMPRGVVKVNETPCVKQMNDLVDWTFPAGSPIHKKWDAIVAALQKV